MRSRLPLVLSITALVVAVLGSTPLGQAAYNAVVPKNSIGADQLKNGAVTNAKLRGDAVSSGKVKNGSLRGIDFAPGQIPAGPKGDTGDKGAKGSAGDPGISGYQIVRASTTIPPNTLSVAQAHCPTGKKVIGGAASVQGVPQVIVHTNLTGDNNYDALATNKTASPIQLNAVAICAVVAP